MTDLQHLRWGKFSPLDRKFPVYELMDDGVIMLHITKAEDQTFEIAFHEGASGRVFDFTRGLSPTKEIIGFGLPHLGAGKLASINDFQIRNLCRGHNSALSEVDQAAIDVMNVARETNEAAKTRLASPGQQWDCLSYQLDGIKFERWALKTTISMAQVGAKDWQWTPPSDFPHLVFAKKPIPKGCGLAFMDGVQDPSQAHNGVSCNYYRLKESGGVVASIIGFGGFMLLCSWSTPIDTLVPIRSKQFSAETATLHKSAVEIPGTNIWTKFDWTGTFDNGANPELIALRSKYASPPR